MLRPDIPLYFYGEFGCLNYCILGQLEERKHERFSIYTQPDYYKLMKMKCPQIRHASDEILYRANMKGSGFGFTVGSKSVKHLEDFGCLPLHKYLKLSSKKCIDHLKLTKKKLEFDLGLKKEYISISFRNRKHEPSRNLSKNIWELVIEIIKECSDLEIIAHGMEMDTLSSKEFNIKKVETIEESIAYMNKSKVFIASMSGIAQFASNCGCPIIQIGPEHIMYDPFDAGCFATNDLVEFKSLFRKIIKKQISTF